MGQEFLGNILLQSITKLTLAFVLLFWGWQANAANPIFVLNSQDANVSVIDPQTWAVTQRIPTGKEPHHLYLTPDEKSVIVANAVGHAQPAGRRGMAVTVVCGAWVVCPAAD